jgi:hypothetical protein
MMKNLLRKSKKYLSGKFGKKDESQELNQIFFKDGFMQQPFLKGSAYRNFIMVVESIYNNSLKDGFFFEERYPKTIDLKPNIFSYDDCFFEILKENNILDLLESVTGSKLTLGHVQLRIASPSNKSYMNWHRDTHFYKGENFIGNTPPVIKLIIYPVFGDEDVTLKVHKGSHLKYHDTLKEDLNYIKKNHEKICDIRASNNSFLIFNTALPHSANPPSGESSSVRVIYSFCTEYQLKNYNISEEFKAKYNHIMS